MSRGLWKPHHAAQTMQAKRDFYQLANKAINAGCTLLVKRYMYPERAGWRTVDKHLVRLREALEAKQQLNNSRAS